MENKKWYAVQYRSDDDWDTGSFDFDEAKDMLKKQGLGLIAVIADDYCEEEITFDDLFDLNDFDDDELADFVRNAGSWDEIGVQERMEILAHRANSELWEMYKLGKSDDQDVCITWAEDILSWVGKENDFDNSDDKVWEAGTVFENLAKDPSPYKSSDIDYSVYVGWESIATYIQTILNVDLGI